jgi:hypothetical protein
LLALQRHYGWDRYGAVEFDSHTSGWNMYFGLHAALGLSTPLCDSKRGQPAIEAPCRGRVVEASVTTAFTSDKPMVLFGFTVMSPEFFF